ncbi:MAG: type I pullulanase [Lachnospiraceae bacterium]|nr:type I pullulanase [Lachnospiraceae bacterium]
MSLYQSEAFRQEFTYTGTDLGATCTGDGTSFLVWSPQAQDITLCLYSAKDNGHPSSTPARRIPLKKHPHGVWVYRTKESLHGTYYLYLVTIDGKTQETTDPYARACSANGVLSMVVDLSLTNPDGWKEDRGPLLTSPTDAILYELHIRDLSMDVSSGIQNKGLFTGLAEHGTHNPDGFATGLDHIRELGVTHVHLLPCFDFSSVDETAPDFNWGYDPANYNIPEGSYSTDPDNGTVRILEMKKMIQALHQAGLGVIMDVVYNHTASSKDSPFNRLVPYYYYRIKQDGSFANGSACGNETASEHSMMRSFLVDSVAYWAKEYHIDGFRFDLMGLHDIDTMRAIRARLDEINPQLLMYGEGWTGGESPLKEEMRATKANIARIPGVAAFNDNLRDAIKGGVFDLRGKGFVTGKKNLCEDIRFGICGCCPHPQVDLTNVRSANTFWAAAPTQCINYVSAHDNLTLWDKLASSFPSGTKALHIRMNKLAAAIYLTAQGIPFFQAGEEFLRSKPAADGSGFDGNSYRSSDLVNSLKWKELTKYHQVYEYYRGLISLRKAHPAFRLRLAAEIAKHLSFLPDVPENTVGYLLLGHAGGDALKEICVLLNPNRHAVQFYIPNGTWLVYVDAELAGCEPFGEMKGETVIVPSVSCMVLGR